MVTLGPRFDACIYCDQPTDSKEHLFLASCGGLKQDLSILCGECNRNFGRTLDIELTNCLREINGLLGVQDRDQNQKPAIFNDPKTGHSYEVDRHGAIRLADPVVRGERESGGTVRMDVSGGTQKQLDDWISAKKKAGYKVVDRTPRIITHQSGPVSLSKEMTVSNKVTMRESARIALNFLAHYYPKIARAPELLQVKNYITSPDADICAFYTLTSQASCFGPNSFRFGHRVSLVYDADLGRLFALVDYFSAITILINLGQISLNEPLLKVIDIDPLAEREPDDIKVRDDLKAGPKPIPYLPLAEADTGLFFDEMEARITKLIQDIHQYRNEQVSITALRRIKRSKQLLSEDELFSCLACADSLIFESLREKMLLICEYINQMGESNEGYQVVADVLCHMVGRPSSPGFSVVHPAIVASVEACRRKLARQIIETFTSSAQVTLTFLNGLLSEQGIVGYFACRLVDRLVRGNLGEEGYQILAKRLYSAQ